MGVKEIKEELANNLNYKFNEGLNIVHGHTEGYTSMIVPLDQYETSYQIIYCVTKDGNQLNKADFESLKKENKIIVNVIVNKYRLIVTVRNSGKKEEKINNIIEVNKIMTDYLRQNGYQNIDEQTGEEGNTTVCNVQGEPKFIMTKTLEEMKNKNADSEVMKKEENVVKGIIGAILGSLVGVFAIVALGQLGFIAVVSGIIMAACTVIGYNKLAGGISKKGLAISVIIMIIMTYIGVRIDDTIIVYNALKDSGIALYGNISFGDVFEHLPEIIKIDAELETAYIRDIILTYVFTAIGIIGITKVKLDEIKNSNVYEIL